MHLRAHRFRDGGRRIGIIRGHLGIIHAKIEHFMPLFAQIFHQMIF